MKRLIVMCLLVPLLGCAATMAEPETAGAAQLSSAQEIVAARKAAFMLSGATYGGMGPTVESGGDVKTLAFGARGLAAWADALPGMFPEGTAIPGSAALPAIWQDRPGFEAQASAFRAATAELSAAAQAGDKARFKTAYGTVAQACGSCHTAYRAESSR